MGEEEEEEEGVEAEVEEEEEEEEEIQRRSMLALNTPPCRVIRAAPDVHHAGRDAALLANGVDRGAQLGALRRRERQFCLQQGSPPLNHLM